jgi:hypothetical protein
MKWRATVHEEQIIAVIVNVQAQVGEYLPETSINLNETNWKAMGTAFLRDEKSSRISYLSNWQPLKAKNHKNRCIEAAESKSHLAIIDKGNIK